MQHRCKRPNPAARPPRRLLVRRELAGLPVFTQCLLTCCLLLTSFSHRQNYVHSTPPLSSPSPVLSPSPSSPRTKQYSSGRWRDATVAHDAPDAIGAATRCVSRFLLSPPHPLAICQPVLAAPPTRASPSLTFLSLILPHHQCSRPRRRAPARPDHHPRRRAGCQWGR